VAKVAAADLGEIGPVFLWSFRSTGATDSTTFGDDLINRLTGNMTLVLGSTLRIGGNVRR
jgi:hypothetical protein